MHVDPAAVARSERDEATRRSHHQRRRVVAGDVVGSLSDVENAEDVERLLPKRTGLCELTRDGRGVVDQYIQALLFAIDSFEQSFDLVVVRVVTGECDTLAPGVRHGLGGGFHRPAERMVLAAVFAATGHVDRGARCAECDRDAFADATARAGDDSDLAARVAHDARLLARRAPRSTSLGSIARRALERSARAPPPGGQSPRRTRPRDGFRTSPRQRRSRARSCSMRP